MTQIGVPAIVLATCARHAAGLWSEEQDHFANLTAIEALLGSGDSDAALRLLGQDSELGDFYSAVATRIESRLVAGLLVGKTDIARQSGVEFGIDPRSRLRHLPIQLNESGAVSIVGNLVQNAFDAVAGVPRERRRVKLLVSDVGKRLVVRVRDWGSGLGSATDEMLLSRGFSTKPGHSGVGLSLVRELAESAGGSLTIERFDVGAALAVAIPDA